MPDRVSWWWRTVERRGYNAASVAASYARCARLLADDRRSTSDSRRSTVDRRAPARRACSARTLYPVRRCRVRFHGGLSWWRRWAVRRVWRARGFCWSTAERWCRWGGSRYEQGPTRSSTFRLRHLRAHNQQVRLPNVTPRQHTGPFRL